MTIVPRTGPFSASSALATTSWYHAGKSSACGVRIGAFAIGGAGYGGSSCEGHQRADGRRESGMHSLQYDERLHRREPTASSTARADAQRSADDHTDHAGKKHQDRDPAEPSQSQAGGDAQHAEPREPQTPAQQGDPALERRRRSAATSRDSACGSSRRSRRAPTDRSVRPAATATRHRAAWARPATRSHRRALLSCNTPAEAARPTHRRVGREPFRSRALGGDDARHPGNVTSRHGDTDDAFDSGRWWAAPRRSLAGRRTRRAGDPRRHVIAYRVVDDRRAARGSRDRHRSRFPRRRR